MKNQFVLFVSSLFWSCAFSQSCITPLGVRSTCINLYDCPSFVKAFDHKPLQTEIVNFMRQSQCGFSGLTPLVCCGPLPSDVNNTAETASRTPIDVVDPVSDEDSRPAPRNSCGVDILENKILGGNITELDEYPWMALMGYMGTPSGSKKYKCGGALVNQRYVLTAAHCITGAIETQVGKLTSVRLGEYDTQKEIDCVKGICANPVQEIPVHVAVPHPGYRDKSRNKKDDIGLVRLARRVTYSYTVQPICLVSGNEYHHGSGAQVVVAGWGKTLEGISSPIKMKLTMSMVNHDDCYNKYQTIRVAITNKQLCAGGVEAQDACAGDSGGPLMRQRPEGVWESVGIVSSGFGCGRGGWPGIYTALASYLDWIESTMRSTNQ